MRDEPRALLIGTAIEVALALALALALISAVTIWMRDRAQVAECVTGWERCQTVGALTLELAQLCASQLRAQDLQRGAIVMDPAIIEVTP